MKKLLVALVLLHVLAGAGLSGESWTGVCTKVKDGDSVIVDRDGTPVELRLFGIDAPEGDQPFGIQARRHAVELMHGRKLQVEDLGLDKYERTLAWVRIDGRNINEEMVCSGFAWWYQFYAPNESRLEQCEREAREAKKGLWADPMPPWEWRALKRKGKGS